MSNMRGITTAIAAVTVSYTKEEGGTATPTAYDVSALPTSVPAANLPVRLMGVTRGESSASLTPTTAGVSTGQVAHSITELCLIELVGLSRVADEWPDTMRYADALVTALQSNRSIAAHAEITSANLQRGVFEYPANSNEQFYGCQTIINVMEIQ